MAIKNINDREFRVMYVGAEKIMLLLKRDFLLTGAKEDSENPMLCVLSGKFLKKLAINTGKFPTVRVNFYSDIYLLAKNLPVFDADLIILDERSGEENEFVDEAEKSLTELYKRRLEGVLNSNELPHVLNSLQPSVKEQKKQISTVNFDNLQSAIRKFTPRYFLYTMRRVTVVLPKSARSTNREFTLGLSNVRGVIVDPKSSVELFLYTIRQALDFRQSYTKTSLCISGGGLEGYIYSLGVLKAIEACFLEKSCLDFDIFCGVSSGAIAASCMAASMSVKDLEQQLKREHSSLDPLGLNIIFDLATGEMIKRSLGFLRAFSSLDVAEMLSRMQNSVPLGFFKGEKLKKFFAKQLLRVGVRDKISALKKELYISVTDQDTCENVVFGDEPWRDVKISEAIRASTALPPFYLPEKINGHWFSDGQLTGASDFNIAIRKGAGLVVYIDPMVAYSSNKAGEVMQRGGYFSMIQAVKSLVHTRSISLMQNAMDSHPDVDFVSFSPTDNLMEAMAGNPMKYHIRTELIDLAYRCTLAQVLASYEGLAHKFNRHGFRLKNKDAILNLLSGQKTN